MNRCLISSCVGAVSTNARRGLLVVLGEVHESRRSLRCPSFLSVVISFCDLNLKVGTALL